MTPALVAVLHVALPFAAGVFITWMVGSFRRFSQLDELTRATEELAAQSLESTALIEEQAKQITDLSAKAEAEYQHRVKTVESIVVIERDRDGWKTRYWDCGLGHSVAQSMLMREITRLIMILKRHDIKFKENLACGQVVKEFSEAHLGQKQGDRILVGEVASGIANAVDVAVP